MPNVRVANFFGGFPIKQQIEQLKTNPPHAVVGTPGRVKQVSRCFLVVDSLMLVLSCLEAGLLTRIVLRETVLVWCPCSSQGMAT